MRSGVLHRGGLPGQPGRVTHLAGVSLLYVNAEGGVIRIAGVMSSGNLSLILNSEFLNSAKARQNNVAANPYKPSELFRRFHLQNKKNSFSEENTYHAIAF